MYQINVGERWRELPVDIIVPYHKQYQIVENTCRAIATTPTPFRLTLVDDHSANSAFGESFSKRGTNVIRLPKHSGFGAALAAGFAATTSPFVCFMHSDIIVQDSRWLRELQRSLISAGNETAFVVPRTDNPGEAAELKGKLREYSKDYQFMGATCPLYCFLGFRKVFETIGLPKPYPYALYEDDEYSHRLRKRGKRIVVSGKSWVSHIGGATINSLYKNPNIAKEMDLNRERCIQDMRIA